MVHVTAVEPLKGFVVRLTFDDGLVREIDLDPLMHGAVFADIRKSLELFRQVSVDKEIGTIVWPNGADMAPEVLHGDYEPAWQPSKGAM